MMLMSVNWSDWEWLFWSLSALHWGSVMQCRCVYSTVSESEFLSGSLIV
jgi:hypothetical protein